MPSLMKARSGVLNSNVGGNALAPLFSTGSLTTANLITDVTRLAGVQGDGAAYPDSSVGLWPAATNLVTQSIPGALATTGVTKAGDAAATLTKVADSTHPFPNATADVWCLDNSAGSTDATVDFAGNATAAAHTASIYAYKTAGSPNLSIEGTSPTAISGATWARYTNTKTATAGDNLRITAPAGAVVYFVAAQLEAGSIANPFILTDGGTASRGAGTITMPADVLDETQMWLAFRAKMGFSTASPPSATLMPFGWRDSATAGLMAYYVGATGLVVRRDSGGIGTTATINPSWSLGDDVLFIVAYTASLVRVSVAGSAFTEAANTTIPTLSSAPYLSNDPVTAGRQIYSTPRWAAAGLGPIIAADVALLNSWGNNDPLPHMFPPSAQLSFLAHFNGDGTFYRRSA